MSLISATRVILFTVGTCLLLWQTPGNAQKQEWTFHIHTYEDFQEIAAELREEMQPDGRYGNIKKRDRQSVENNLKIISELFEKRASSDALNETEQVKLVNAQEHINAILTNNKDDRLICKRERRTGTHFASRSCFTAREWEERRLETQRQFSEASRPTVPPPDITP